MKVELQVSPSVSHLVVWTRRPIETRHFGSFVLQSENKLNLGQNFLFGCRSAC